MNDSLASVGFAYSDLDEFSRLCSRVKHEGEIITTTIGTYYHWAVPTDRDYEVELWLKASHDGKSYVITPHFRGGAEGEFELLAALARPTWPIYDGGFRFIYDREISGSEYTLCMPLVFVCPNFDCAENFAVPFTTRVQLSGIAAHIKCYEDEAAYRASGEHPIPEDGRLDNIFATDIVRDDKFNPHPESPIAHIAGHVLETEIMTNPATGYEFIWAIISTGDFGEIDVVAAPDGLQGFLRAGGMVSGTILLSGLLLDL